MLRIALVLSLAACGPVTYVGEVTRNASTSFDKATALQADRYAPYYYTRAKEYLHAARESVARADFQGANRFGKLAREAADQAAIDAVAAAADPSKRPLEEPGKAPAKAKTLDDEQPLAPVK